MAGPKLPRKARNLIESAIDRLYDSLKTKFLGPTVQRMKPIKFSYQHELTLPGMFEAANIEEGTKPNTDTLDSLMRIGEAYIDANRQRTKAKVVKEVMATLEEAHRGKVKTDLETVLNGKLIDAMGDAQANIEAIVGTEINTAKNLGVLDGVVAVNTAAGIEDPTVAFLVAKRVSDDAPCDECVRLHCTAGIGSPPRLWKLSQVEHGYHKKGDNLPAIGGLHPSCRCGMVTVLLGFGYEGGDTVHFVKPGYDEYAVQQADEDIKLD